MGTRALSLEEPGHRPLRQLYHAEPAVGNIPNEVNAFVGRGAELDRLHDLHEQARLLTLVGPSGVGKTRLALRLAADVREAYPGGTWLVDLSPVADPALVPQAVGDALGVQQQPGQPWLSELIRAVGARRLVLLLDNCEHLIAACAELADGLLRACPELRLLATSLQPLGAASETVWRLQPLSVPRPEANTLASLEASDAVRLFVTRLRSHLFDFALDERTAPVVAGICRRLDGLPLALELVAARVEGLGLAEVATRLQDRFALARGASQTAPRRQRTLHAALEWTCSLLDERERVLLRRLAVFAGGWTLEAASAVCGGDALDADAMADVLGQLVTKSLVVAERDELTVRFRLLETVHAYALGELIAADERAALQDRHAGYLLELVERVAPESGDTAQAARLRPEEDNLRAALEWAIETQQAELGLRMGTAAFVLWWFTGHYAEGAAWLDRLLALPGAAAAAGRSLALSVNGQLRLMLGDYALAQAHGQAALDDQHARGNAYGVALALEVLGNVALQRGNLAEADVLHTDATRRKRELGSLYRSSNLQQLGLVACELGDVARARGIIVELQDLGHARQEPVVLAWALQLRGLVAAGQADPGTGATLVEQAMALQRQAGDQQGLVKSLTSLGHLRLDQGQTATALAAFAEATRLARASGERVRLIRALEGWARGLASRDADAAVRLAAAAQRQRETLGAAPWPSERRYLDSWLAQARRVLGPDTYLRAWDDGHASTLDQAVSLAEALTAGPPAAGPPAAARPGRSAPASNRWRACSHGA